jgi:hypothetical protein
MNDCRRISILAAALLIAVTGVAWAEQNEPSPPPQRTNWFLSWLMPSTTPVVAPKPRPPSTGRLAAAPEAAKPRQNCTLLTCITLVGIGF